MMQEDQERSRRRKALWLLLLPLLLLCLAGGLLVAVDDDDKPGSDVLGLNVPPTTEPTEPTSPSAGAPAAPAPTSDVVKGSGKSTSSGNDTVGAATQSGGSADPNGPQPPSITRGPDDPTFDTTAQFRFAGKQSGLGFRCSLDGGQYSSCNSGTANFNQLAAGERTFRVVAVDSSGRVSAPTTYTWTILLKDGFEITGSLAELLFPGSRQSLNLSIGNPYNFPLRVLSVQVTVEPETTKNGAANPGCAGNVNLSVVHSLTTEVVVPAHSTTTLQQLIPLQQSAWPLLEMPNLPTNQDACKNTTFKLSYQGTGTKV